MSNPEGFDPTPSAQGDAGAVTPGWYPDPQSGALRWWDGQQWGQFQQGAGVPVPVTATGGGDPRSSAALAHYLGIIGFLGPLIIYLTAGDKDPFVKDQSAEALNFHLTVLAAYIVSSLLMFVCIGFILLPLVWIGEIVFSIMGGMAASKGQWYRYPINVRLIKVATV